MDWSVFKAIILCVIFTDGICQSIITVQKVEITVTFSKQSAAFGQQVKLVCVTNRTQPVEWTFHPETGQKSLLYYNGNITDFFRERARTGTDAAGTYSIILQSVKSSDAGTYKCEEVGDDGSKHKIQLIVQPYLSVRVGSTFVLVCYSSTHDVDWLYHHNDNENEVLIYTRGQFQNIEFKNRFRLSHRNGSSEDFSLTVTDAQPADSGYYSCNEGNVSSTITKHEVEVIAYISATVGENISLPCHSMATVQVDWDFYKSKTDIWKPVYTDGKIRNGYKGRFTIDIVQGQQNLLVKDVHLNDSGIYTCFEVGEQRREQKDSLELIVSENEQLDTNTVPGVPESNYNATSNYSYFGDASSHIVDHSAVVAPVVGVIVGLIIIGILIFLIYYKRHYWLPKIQCLQKDVPDETLGLLPIDEDKSNIENLFVKFPIEMLELLLVKTIISSFIQHKTMTSLADFEALETVWSTCSMWKEIIMNRKFLQHQIRRTIDNLCGQYKRRLKLLGTLTVDDECEVTGVAQLDDKIFVTCKNSGKVRVYGASKPYSHLDDIDEEGMTDPVDLIACNEHIYVADQTEQCIRPVKTNGSSIPFEHLQSLAVKDGNIVVTYNSEPKVITVYSPVEENQVQEVKLKSHFDMIHAVATTATKKDAEKDTFTICYYNKDDKLCQVCKLNPTGEVVSPVFGSQDELKDPQHIAVDDDGHVFVADTGNGRVILLDSQLKLERVLLDTSPAQPVRMCYIQQTGLMLVALKKCVNVYKIVKNTHT